MGSSPDGPRRPPARQPRGQPVYLVVPLEEAPQLLIPNGDQGLRSASRLPDPSSGPPREVLTGPPREYVNRRQGTNLGWSQSWKPTALTFVQPLPGCKANPAACGVNFYPHDNSLRKKGVGHCCSQWPLVGGKSWPESTRQGEREGGGWTQSPRGPPLPQQGQRSRPFVGERPAGGQEGPEQGSLSEWREGQEERRAVPTRQRRAN